MEQVLHRAQLVGGLGGIATNRLQQLSVSASDTSVPEQVIDRPQRDAGVGMKQGHVVGGPLEPE